MKFERGNNPKESLEIGQYSNMLVVENVLWEVHGANTIVITFPQKAAESFLSSLSSGIRMLPDEMKLPNGLWREEYRLATIYKDGSGGNHTSNVPGEIIKFLPTGKIYHIPKKLTDKVKTYEF